MIRLVRVPEITLSVDLPFCLAVRFSIASSSSVKTCTGNLKVHIEFYEDLVEFPNWLLQRLYLRKSHPLCLVGQLR